MKPEEILEHFKEKGHGHTILVSGPNGLDGRIFFNELSALMMIQYALHERPTSTCSNCDREVEMVSEGSFCPKCYC
jgi:translation initiation factor 2 gamma subunit (eIF-2gamma)